MITRRFGRTGLEMPGPQHSGIPLGGLGTGTVTVQADGWFHDWRFMNSAPWGAGPSWDRSWHCDWFCGRQGFWMAVQAGIGDMARTAVLGRSFGFDPLLGNPYHQPFLEFPEELAAELAFPDARFAYRFRRGFPLAVSTRMWSPFIPHQAADSAWPMAVIEVTIANRTTRHLTASLAAGLRNLVGLGHRDLPSTIVPERDGGAFRLRFGRAGQSAGEIDAGSMTIGVVDPGGWQASWMAHPRHDRDVWDPLRATGQLDSVDWGNEVGRAGNAGAEVSSGGRTHDPLGVLALKGRLKPRGRHTLTLLLTWHFPNFRECDYGPRQIAGRVIGHAYATRFADASDVARAAAEALPRLRAGTDAFSATMARSSLSAWQRDAVTSQLTTLRTSSWWDASDRFAIWEGLGLCGLQTVDVAHYGSEPVLALFPDRERSSLELTLANFQGPGHVPHLMPAHLATTDIEPVQRIDLPYQYVLACCRHVRATGDLEWGRRLWPHLQECLRWADSRDSDGDGLPDHQGPDQTYDQFPMRGASSFVGLLHVAAFRAAADLAGGLGDTAIATAFRERATRDLVTWDAKLWNGRWYRLSADGDQTNEGVLADMVNADGWCRMFLGFSLLPDTRVRACLRQVIRHCRKGDDAIAWLANAAWPVGSPTTIRRTTSDQANLPWTGIEYFLAAHCQEVGLEAEASALLRATWERNERFGLRFAHVECGSHYYRALAVWSWMSAWLGGRYDAQSRTLHLRMPQRTRRGMFACPQAWGELEVSPGGASLRLVAGELRIDRLVVDGCELRWAATVARAGRRLRLLPGNEGQVRQPARAK
jgi:uncharacterized protein (DUF608 family)